MESKGKKKLKKSGWLTGIETVTDVSFSASPTPLTTRPGSMLLMVEALSVCYLSLTTDAVADELAEDAAQR